jgi:hypothetical protein
MHGFGTERRTGSGLGEGRRVLWGIALIASTLLGTAAGADQATSGEGQRAARPAHHLELHLRAWVTAGVDGGEGRASPTELPRQRPGDDPDGIVVGRLVFAQLDVVAEDAPLRSVLSAFARALDINIVPFYETPDRPAPRLAVRADTPINLELRDADARSLLEAIASQAGPDVTWQVHRGILEFGPRATLARENARTIRVYEVTDLAHEPPYFVVPRDLTNSYGFQPMDAGTGETRRMRPVDVIADLVRTISEQCEPKAFEPEPEPDPSDESAPGRRPAPQHTSPAGTSHNPRTAVNTTATRNLDPDLGPVFVRGQWASIHVKDKVIVVNAPDFVHRTINGYPQIVRPR